MVAIKPDYSENRNLDPTNQKCGSTERKSSRKQWSMQGEPRSILKRLRSQLAEDGCPESQYFLAKTLLEHKNDPNYDENCQQAIFWLTQASLQGCLDATNLLQECLNTGLGISEQNYLDVKKCTMMDQEEKLALVAAKHLFNSLSEGNTFITHRTLETKAASALNGDLNECAENEQKVDLNSMKEKQVKRHLEEKFGSHRISEDDLSSAAVVVIRGDLPSIQIRNVRNLHRRKAFKYLRFFSYIPEIILDYLQTISFDQFTYFSNPFIGLFFICSFYFSIFESNKAIWFLLVSMWLASLGCVLNSVLQISICQSSKFIHDTWLSLLSHFSPDLNIDLCKSRYDKKIISHFAFYFFSMVVYLFLCEIIPPGLRFLFVPLFMILSLFLLLMLLLSTDSPSNTFGLFLYIISHYPCDILGLKTLIIYNFPSLSYLDFNKSFMIYGNINLTLYPNSFFQCLWLTFVFWLLLSRGFTRVLIHLTNITFFHLTYSSWRFDDGIWFYYATICGLAVLALCKSGRVFTTLAPIFVVGLCCLASGFSTLVVISISVLLILVFYGISRLNIQLSNLIKFLVFASALSILLHQNIGYNTQVSPLKWDHYQHICQNYKEINSLVNVRNCLSLKGAVVEWEGTVKRVEILSIFNWPKYMLSVFPAILDSKISCIIGSPPLSCEREQFESDNDYQQCLIVQIAKGRDCSLDEWDAFQFAITLSIDSNFWKLSKSSNEITLLAGKEFKDLAFNLYASDKVSFVGVLHPQVNSLHVPDVIVQSISCLDCRVGKLSVNTLPNIELDSELLKNSLPLVFKVILGQF